ncbi:MAG: hypothetical protein NZ700_09445 [Gemmataceae bacterium]|nr:hypothetical protein [Gemmataceae bacterium]MDW8265574.1 hypothetical protein [Gemmataceae bacterium]
MGVARSTAGECVGAANGDTVDADPAVAETAPFGGEIAVGEGTAALAAVAGTEVVVGDGETADADSAAAGGDFTGSTTAGGIGAG